MKTRAENGLLPIIVLAVILVLVETFVDSGFLQALFGLPFIFFCTGYTLILALYPGKKSLGGFERVTISFAFSIVLLALIGLILNYMPFGIRLYPVLVSLILFTIGMAAIAWRRQKHMPKEERFTIAVNIVRLLGSAPSRGSRLLSLALAVVIIATLGTLGYVMATPRVGERFTEFYILGSGGKAEGYPREMAAGETGSLIVGIVNREQETATYRVEVRLDGTKLNEAGPVRLEPEARWEQPVSFTPGKVGTDLKLEFVLFREGQAEPYLKPVYIWLNVK